MIGPVLARPWLWREAVRLVPKGWWRRRPFLPLPSRDYLAFRMETQYGRADARPDPHDLVVYLQWCRTMRQLTR